MRKHSCDVKKSVTTLSLLERSDGIPHKIAKTHIDNAVAIVRRVARFPPPIQKELNVNT